MIANCRMIASSSIHRRPPLKTSGVRTTPRSAATLRRLRRLRPLQRIVLRRFEGPRILELRNLESVETLGSGMTQSLVELLEQLPNCPDIAWIFPRPCSGALASALRHGILSSFKDV